MDMSASAPNSMALPVEGDEWLSQPDPQDMEDLDAPITSVNIGDISSDLPVSLEAESFWVKTAEASGLAAMQVALMTMWDMEELGADDWEESEYDEPAAQSDKEDSDKDSGCHDEGGDGESDRQNTLEMSLTLSPLPSSPAPLFTSPGHICDPHNENLPDPFQYDAVPLPLPLGPSDVHPNFTIFIIYTLVLWLHSQCHLAFKYCNTVLVIFSLCFQVAGAPIDPLPFVMLAGVSNKLRTEPTFKVFPVCPACHTVFPVTMPLMLDCLCGTLLYITAPTPAEAQHGRTSHENPKPILQFLFKSLAKQLAMVLMVPRIEDEIEKSLERIKSHVPE
ncbi:uncharacterized protein ARMOST_10443 [Armillaria ostoyae]|uniref:Uncharacterized protein n=1 Tax=Armillaria ostoyae TaxID=47428 RepID=A0A284REA6_ARMOS|nr:uncharacterized protein ARMOST_10443 [Armillaria ostoyae]